MRCFVSFLLIIGFVYCACPSGFDLVSEGQCRGIGELEVRTKWSTADRAALSICDDLDSTPIIIRNEEQQNYWTSKAAPKYPPYLVIGITCNRTTNRWQWFDGSKIDYKPEEYNVGLDQACFQSCAWYVTSSGRWSNSCSDNTNTFDIYCISDLPPPRKSADHCLGNVCYKASTTPAQFNTAEEACNILQANLASIHSDQENSYIRRLAVSHGNTNGVMLGAKKIGDSFNWIDKSDFDYDNFASETGTGKCVKMDTSDTAGTWSLVDCNEPMPFVCSRSNTTKAKCQGGSTKPGTLITSPGFPYDASVPCSYNLVVEKGSRVLLEVILLEANSCCDKLVLYEGSKEIASLTGTVSNATFSTSSSNEMRAEWVPNGGVNVRGMMITYRTLEA